MAFSYKDYVESEAVKRLREQASQYGTYNESQAVIDSLNAYKQKEANKIADWTGGTYGQSLKDQMDKINNREKFTYDLNGDALYQQYKDQYMTQGRLASADAIGQASTMTGGYGNSYAATVGNQAYQGYLQKLNDVVPELYNMAYNRYQQEGQDMKDMYAMYESAYGREYGEHRDKVGDYNTELARLQDAYYNEKNFDYSKFSTDRAFYNDAYNNERTYDYGQYNDAYNRAFGQYQQGVAEDQWQKSYDLQKAAASSSGGSTYKQGGSEESDFVRRGHHDRRLSGRILPHLLLPRDLRGHGGDRYRLGIHQRKFLSHGSRNVHRSRCGPLHRHLLHLLHGGTDRDTHPLRCADRSIRLPYSLPLCRNLLRTCPVHHVAGTPR